MRRSVIFLTERTAVACQKCVFRKPKETPMTGQKRELSPEEIERVSGGNFEIQRLMSAYNQAESSQASKKEHDIYMNAVRHLVA